MRLNIDCAKSFSGCPVHCSVTPTGSFAAAILLSPPEAGVPCNSTTTPP